MHYSLAEWQIIKPPWVKETHKWLPWQLWHKLYLFLENAEFFKIIFLKKENNCVKGKNE